MSYTKKAITNNDKANIICPYFVDSQQRKIICDSVFSESMTMTFSNNKKRDTYIYNFCSCGCWQGCPVAFFNINNEA